jgi:hypothetical protein
MRAVTLEELASWDISRPQVQRLVDEHRVHDIVAFQRDMHRRLGSLWFTGCITLASSDGGGGGSSTVLLLVDGQHRLDAMRRLVQLQPDYKVWVDIIPEDVTDLLSVEQVFRVINKAEPVPEYVIDTIGKVHQRQFLDEVNRQLRDVFRPFDSRSAAPRAPNLRLDALAVAVCNPDVLQDLGHSVARVMDMVCWVNEQLGQQPWPKLEAARHKATKNRTLVCALGLHRDWSDPQTWHIWCRSHYLPRVPLESWGDKAPRPARVPARLKQQVWDTLFPGERYGRCQVCRRVLDLLDHEAGHIVPASRGGAANLQNLVPVCHRCNKSMGAQHMEAYCTSHGYCPHTPFCDLSTRQQRDDTKALQRAV